MAVNWAPIEADKFEGEKIKMEIRERRERRSFQDVAVKSSITTPEATPETIKVTYDYWSAGGIGSCAHGTMYLIVEHLGEGKCKVSDWSSSSTSATGNKCGMFYDEEIQFSEAFEAVKDREFQLPEGVDFKTEGIKKTILEILKK
ncbi:MAG: hypothetical protein LBL47_02910 [Lactobacillus sp.]|jgi:hypothetical protein|nr:hypothetical protein [Lactobacillus sp.]